jgi:hypothetical protein
LIGLMNHTLSSNLVTEFVKRRRMIICTKVVESTSIIDPWWILRRVLQGDWYRFIECIEFGLFLQNWNSIAHPATSFYAQCVAALTFSSVRDRDRDERWFQLASGLLDVSKSHLHIYIKHGDSILLAIATFIARQTVQTYSGSEERHRDDILDVSSKTLEKVCKLNIKGTLPDLQHDFCGLWNQLVNTAQNDSRPRHVFISKETLKNIRKLYIALHESSGGPPTAFYTTTDDRDPVLDNPISYPRCAIDGHHPLPVQDLRFNEPADVRDAPNIISMPVPTVTFPYPLPWLPLFRSTLPPGPSPYDAPFADPLSAGPPPDATVVFPEPRLSLPHASSVPPEEIGQSPPPPVPPSPPPPPPLSSSPLPFSASPPPAGFASDCSEASFHPDHASNQISDSSGGHT